MSVITSVAVFAQESTSNPGAEIWDYLLQYGVLGVTFILFVTRKIRTEGEVKDRDEVIRQKDVIIEQYRQRYEQAIPLLAEAVRLLPGISEQARGKGSGT